MVEPVWSGGQKTNDEERILHSFSYFGYIQFQACPFHKLGAGTSNFKHPLLKNVWNYTRFGTLILATIYLQLIQNRYMFRSFTVLQCSHQHCVQPVASDVEVVGYL